MPGPLHNIVKMATGYGIKLWVLYILYKQEKNRYYKFILLQYQKYDSGIESYNMFHGRSELIPEQPESVFYIDKFMQPNHLYLHSDNKDKTVTLYEAFRGPRFVPRRLKRDLAKGLYKTHYTPAEYFKDQKLETIHDLSQEQLIEYFQYIPGHIGEKWVTESQVQSQVRFIDELQTPSSMLPQYLFYHYDENDTSFVPKDPTQLFRIFERDFLLKFYEKKHKFFYWNRMHLMGTIDHCFHRNVYKLKKEYEHRMIRKGYKNASNKSLGKYFDIERSFHGYPGPLTIKPRYKLD